MEVIPVSLADPWAGIIVEESTMKLLSFLPIISFIALLFAAVWRQAKRFPVRAIGDVNVNNRKF